MCTIIIIIINPVVMVRKLRHRVVKKLFQDLIVKSGGTRNGTQVRYPRSHTPWPSGV